MLTNLVTRCALRTNDRKLFHLNIRCIALRSYLATCAGRLFPNAYLYLVGANAYDGSFMFYLVIHNFLNIDSSSLNHL